MFFEFCLGFPFIGNPFKQTRFDASRFTFETIKGSDQDLEYALKFLYSYNGSVATYNSYRRELERFLQWSWNVEKTSVLNHRRENIEEFINFCFNPPLAWIGTKNVSRFVRRAGVRVPNSQWRPFVVNISKQDFRNGIEIDKKQYSLSQAAAKGVFTALVSFYNYLIEEQLTDANPVALIRQKSKYIRKEQMKPVVRRISNLQWDYVLEIVEIMASENPEQHERSLFIMNCLYSMYLRISELVADERSVPVMGDFKRDQDGNWWLHVIGKGNKSRNITVCDDMLNALKHYRSYLGLTPLPEPNDKTPLIAKAKGKGSITSTRHIRLIVQTCFDTAFDRMEKDGLVDDAMDLKVATVHWLRHTGISEDVKDRPREHVRDDAGHATMATTDRYIESDLRERHASGRKKRVREAVESSSFMAAD
ncbi:tyrosine-type recombinase/integrase [Ketobacter sp. MCCC 1A13808]|nr:tyrosine-type recombinase/integrase [Ketobacter sp. MCCC 1A13808]